MLRTWGCLGLPNQLVLLGVGGRLSRFGPLGLRDVVETPAHPRRLLGLRTAGTARGVLRARWAGVLAAITVMVAVGLFLPLLGWSLVAFVILDTAIGAVKRRRRARAADPTSAQASPTPTTTPLR